MDDVVPTAKSGLSGIDMVGYISIFAGAASLLLAGWAWASPLLEDPLRTTAVVRSVTFAALAVAYGLGILQRRKVVLHRAWCLLPLLGAGLTPIGLVSIGLLAWFTQRLRKRQNVFAA
jgi:hypothetical protein